MYVYIYIYIERERYTYIYIYIYTCIHTPNGHPVFQGNVPLRTSQLKHILKLLARKRLGARWAKYPFRRCRYLGETESLDNKSARPARVRRMTQDHSNGPKVFPRFGPAPRVRNSPERQEPYENPVEVLGM